METGGGAGCIFADIPERYAAYDAAHFVVVPVPYEATTSYAKGTRAGPEAILNASQQLELYDEQYALYPYRAGINTAGFVRVGTDFDEMVAEVSGVVKGIVADGKVPVVLGGEHTVTLGALKVLSAQYPELSIIQLDAHTDMRREYNGSPYSHACVMRRALEMVQGNLLQWGIRSISEEEVELVGFGRISTLFACRINSGGYDVDELLRHTGEQVYVTVDMDVFDPSLVPGTGTPEPGGPGWYEVVGFLEKIAESKQVVGLDVVELRPLSCSPVSEFTAAKIIYKFIGLISRANGWLM